MLFVLHPNKKAHESNVWAVSRGSEMLLALEPKAGFQTLSDYRHLERPTDARSSLGNMCRIPGTGCRNLSLVKWTWIQRHSGNALERYFLSSDLNAILIELETLQGSLGRPSSTSWCHSSHLLRQARWTCPFGSLSSDCKSSTAVGVTHDLDCCLAEALTHNFFKPYVLAQK